MFTLRDFHKNPRAVQVEDMYFFSPMRIDFPETRKFGSWLARQRWFRKLTGLKINRAKIKESDFLVSDSCFRKLGDAFNQARLNDQESSWFKHLPLEIFRRLEFEYLSWAFDPRILPELTYAGVGCIVADNGLIEATVKNLDLGRLGGVRQLGSLHDPVISNNPWRDRGTSFVHTRLQHSFEVCIIATLIGKRCDLDSQSLDLLRVAAMSHDCLTPAGGDTIKSVDPETFDEDVHFPKVLEREKWQEVRDRYCIDENLLIQTILGNGLLGSILDIADKLAYVSTDLAMFLDKNPPGHQAWEDFQETYDRIRWLLNRNSLPCSVWECAELCNGELVFTDTERLGDFFRMRAIMTRILYNNAASRFEEAAFISLVAKELYKQGVITRDSLLNMTDQQLFHIMGVALGIAWFDSDLVLGQDPRVETFTTLKEAREFERGIVKSEPGIMTHYERAPKPSTDCLRKFKVLDNGKAKPLSQVCPFVLWDVKQILSNDKPHWVYMYNLGDLCKNKDLLSRLLASRDKRVFGSSE